MNQDNTAGLLSLIIPYFFFALWILVPVAIIWGIILLVKKGKEKPQLVRFEL